MGEIEKRLGKLADEINAEHRAFLGSVRKTLEHAIRTGELLAQAKELLKHGEWGAWLERHFEGSSRSAQEYMRLYNHRDEVRAKTRNSADLSVSGALRELASPREPEGDRVLEYHKREANAAPKRAREHCFGTAQSLTAVYEERGYVALGYKDFLSFLKGRHDHSPLYLIADELVDKSGAALDVFTMAGVLFERLPDAYLALIDTDEAKSHPTGRA